MPRVGSLFTTGPVAYKDIILRVIICREHTETRRDTITYQYVNLLKERLKCFVDIDTRLGTHFIE